MRASKRVFGIVHDKASSAFIDNLDTSKDGKVTWNEFSGVAKDVMPGDVQDAQGRIDPQLADAVLPSSTRTKTAPSRLVSSSVGRSTGSRKIPPFARPSLRSPPSSGWTRSIRTATEASTRGVRPGRR